LFVGQGADQVGAAVEAFDLVASVADQARQLVGAVSELRPGRQSAAISDSRSRVQA
jgi:hypothetical protein